MRQASIFTLIGVALVVVLALFGGTRLNAPAHAWQATATKAATVSFAPELPGDIKTLEFGKPLVEGLDANNAIRFYKFTGKAGQICRLSVEPKTGNFFTTLTILSADLEAIIGGTIGENLISGSVMVKLPADGVYVITVEYAVSTTGTPTPGSFEILLSEVKPQ